ncbi:phosphatidylinositol-glycan biosynthesis class x protein [Anaeramoeba flamelloides]|uniref:Phosphatidylinositol-glycan biosynthesis class x protein n=1 Tax=Anaeramoeba flamelloides TaxID=1746091 RepID=A0ABQ8Z806_9EUKA|nr:phosphatidylinositol-glycan biosynthesis class x protein [Anaeramoeba flamelloides]
MFRFSFLLIFTLFFLVNLTEIKSKSQSNQDIGKEQIVDFTNFPLRQKYQVSEKHIQRSVKAFLGVPNHGYEQLTESTKINLVWRNEGLRSGIDFFAAPIATPTETLQLLMKQIFNLDFKLTDKTGLINLNSYPIHESYIQMDELELAKESSQPTHLFFNDFEHALPYSLIVENKFPKIESQESLFDNLLNKLQNCVHCEKKKGKGNNVILNNEELSIQIEIIKTSKKLESISQGLSQNIKDEDFILLQESTNSQTLLFVQFEQKAFGRDLTCKQVSSQGAESVNNNCELESQLENKKCFDPSEITSNSFNVIRGLRENGFHPTLETQLTQIDPNNGNVENKHHNNKKPNSKSWLFECELFLVELFNQKIYIDIYQLDDLARGFGGNVVTHFEHIDLEQPTWAAHQIAVVVNAHNKNITNDVFHASLPIHFRYQKPELNKTTNEVTITHPRYLLKCPNHVMKKYSQTLPNLCNVNTKKEMKNSYHFFQINPSNGETKIVIDFPVGQLQIEKKITMATLVITVLAAIIIFIIVFLKK